MPKLRIRFRGVQTLVPGSKIEAGVTTHVDAMCFLLPNDSFVANDTEEPAGVDDRQSIRCHQAYLETPDAQRDAHASFVTRVSLYRRRVHFEINGAPAMDGVDFDVLDSTLPPDRKSQSLAWLPRMEIIEPAHEVRKQVLAIEPDLRVAAQVVLTTGQLGVDLGDVSGQPLKVTSEYEQQFANAVTWEVDNVSTVTAVLTSLDNPAAEPIRVQLVNFGREGDINVSIGNTCDEVRDQEGTRLGIDEDFVLHYQLLDDVEEGPLPTLVSPDPGGVGTPRRRAEDRAAGRRGIPGINPWFCFGALTTNADLTELAQATALELVET